MASAGDIAAAALKSAVKAAFVTKTKHVTHVEKDKRRDVVLALHQASLHLIAPKGGKIETTMHILDVISINAVTHGNEQAIRITGMNQEWLLANVEAQPSVFVTAIYALLRRIFPHASLSNILNCNIPAKIPRVSTDTPQPCGGFVKAFKVACDYHGIGSIFPGMEELIERYHTSRQREFVADDFHLLQDGFAPALITALLHNSWFTSVVIKNVKLSTETLDALVSLVRRTCHVQRLTLRHIQADTKFWSRLCHALGSNRRQSISHIDFSENSLGDGVVLELAASIETLILGVRELHLASVGMSSKAAAPLARALCANKRSATSLQIIDVSGNNIGQDGVTAVADLLSGSNVLSHLDVSNTGCSLEAVLTTLGTSIFEHLAVLKLADCKFSARKTTRLQPNAIAFFQRSPCLTHLSLAGCKLPKDALKAILDALADNPLLSNVSLNLAHCDLGSDDGCVDVIHHTLPRLACVVALDISANDFGDTGLSRLIGAASSNSKTLRRLDVSHNLGKAKTAEKTLMALRTLFQGSLGIAELDLSHLKLKTDFCKILPALGHNTTIEWLDVSGNMLGDCGIRQVASMLHYNQTLEEVRMDENGVSETGLREIASALRTNKTLKRFPLPFNDIGSALSKASPSLVATLNDIQASLAQNHSPSRHLSAAKTTVVADSSSSKARLLATLVDQVSTVCEDGQEKDEALANASTTVRASGTVFKVQRELEETLTGELAHKFADFGGDLAASLSTMLNTSVQELYAATEAAAGESLDDLFRPTKEDHDTLCKELVVTAVADSACNHVMNAAAQQVSTAAENVTDFIINRAVQRLRAILIARDASGVENVEELPEIKQARQKTHSVRITDLTMSIDVKNEAPIGFELPPADAGKASNNPQLHHANKGRPRHGGRRPPTRQRRARGEDEQGNASTSATVSRTTSSTAVTAPTAAPRKPPPSEAPRVAMRPPPPSRSPPKRTSVVDEEAGSEATAAAPQAPQPKPRPAPPSRPPASKAQQPPEKEEEKKDKAGAEEEGEGKTKRKSGLLGRLFKSASKSHDIAEPEEKEEEKAEADAGAAGGEKTKKTSDESTEAAATAEEPADAPTADAAKSGPSSKRASVAAAPVGSEEATAIEAATAGSSAGDEADKQKADGEEKGGEEKEKAKEPMPAAKPKGVVGGIRLLPPSALKPSAAKVHARLSARLEGEDEDGDKAKDEERQKNKVEDKTEAAEAAGFDEKEAETETGAAEEKEEEEKEDSGAARNGTHDVVAAGAGDEGEEEKAQGTQEEPPVATDAKKDEESTAAQHDEQEEKQEEEGTAAATGAEEEKKHGEEEEEEQQQQEQADAAAEDVKEPSSEEPAATTEGEKEEEKLEAQETSGAAEEEEGGDDGATEEVSEQQAAPAPTGKAQEGEVPQQQEKMPQEEEGEGEGEGEGDELPPPPESAPPPPPPPAAVQAEEPQQEAADEPPQQLPPPPPPGVPVSVDGDDDALPPPPPPAKLLSDTSLLGETQVDRTPSKTSLTHTASRTSVASTISNDEAWDSKPPLAAEKPAPPVSPAKPKPRPPPRGGVAAPPPTAAKTAAAPPPAPAPKPKPKPKPPVRAKSTALSVDESS
ncbi:hypothetical protein PTSG_01330 [Salpingoeca rosetta]|uniref:CARMIL C-terminal domain-containing protein n=1 Tax=Salpingoeca rosetta (strain ATCC 50818 / BSB-021) TaxID=946362 RepID=F2U012_SALR5|nr:uncharacterized protein PTSG_01330 [Salpingoeca rosetta]EGD80740.1 hypothetical protein PTSG_01330 [Salpingoeca rosetta]|eukprot:XP_004997301.1 hypothetical protein PTSG_01330 [Salpingoeca rosetta]